MRKLFSFRSSATSNGNSNPVPPPPTSEKVYWEKPWEPGMKNQENKKVQNRSRRSPSDFVSGPEKQSQERHGSSLRRSLSFSSPAVYSDPGDRNLTGLSDPSTSISSNVLHQSTDFPICCHSPTPERYHHKPKRSDQAAFQKNFVVEKHDSPSSLRGFVDSSGNSAYSSPVPLKCRAARLAQASNKVLDLYIDGEQQERSLRDKTDSQRNSPSIESDGCFMENRKLPSSRLPPQMQSTAPSSPTYGKECLRSSSFMEPRNAHLRNSARDWKRDDVRPTSPQKLAKNVVDRLSHVFPRKSKMKPQDFDYEATSTVEDIFEDFAEPKPRVSSTGNDQNSLLFDHLSFSDAPYEISNGYCTKEVSGFGKHSYFHGDGPVSIKHENSLYLVRKEEDVDAELCRKGREAEERAMLLSEELEPLQLYNSSFSVPALLQIIKNITDDRRSLALEVSSQIQHRIAERASATEALKLSKVELDSRTRRLEKEKNELQSSLEKELDRRSCDWSFKLEKYQLEEQRLRERVRELAEQNVSLQREVSSFNSREVEARSRATHWERQLNDVTERMQEVQGENDNLRQALLELQECNKNSEADRDCIKRNYKEKEKENKELQKAISRLQRICSEQEKTIGGLRQGLSSEVGNQSPGKGDLVAKLQMEQVRLSGVEQVLRREIESCRVEVDSLRHENISLFSRLQETGNGERFSFFKLDQELRDRVEYLQNQCFSLLNESNQLSGKLLEFVKKCQVHVSELGKEINNEFDGYLLVEYDMKFQSIRRGFENIKRSLQTTHEILHDKSELDAPKLQPETKEGAMTGQMQVNVLKEHSIELELKAEILLTRALKEKLYFKELELEQLQAELATSVRGHDILRFEIQRSQDVASCLTHKMKDLELQMMRKNENVNRIQNDLQECMKELTVARGILPKVSGERDLMWEEVKQYSEKNMLLNCEVNSLKKKIEVLEEDILIREGQITILKDNLDKRSFDIL